MFKVHQTHLYIVFFFFFAGAPYKETQFLFSTIGIDYYFACKFSSSISYLRCFASIQKFVILKMLLILTSTGFYSEAQAYYKYVC